MKTITLLASIVLIIFAGCGESSNDKLQNKITMLEQKIDSTYKPGFAEFMTNIQIHHAKLWFAGQAGNWKLADFELKEIEENIDNLKKFRSDRKETQMVIMINPQLDSVNLSIEQKNPALFKTSFTSLTHKCNTCHMLVNYGFNKVKIPDTPPFSNQEFNVKDSALKK
jgi:hypothetical protein